MGWIGTGRVHWDSLRIYLCFTWGLYNVMEVLNRTKAFAATHHYRKVYILKPQPGFELGAVSWHLQVNCCNAAFTTLCDR